MKIIQVHNRYRSAAPSGENRVADTEAAALSALGHEVVRFERSSDEIERWSMARRAALPARVVWSRTAYQDLTTELRAQRPDVVHVHNTFPLLSASVLYACRDFGVPVVATLHNYKLACASGDFFRQGAVCHDCAGRLPVPALLHGCYRDSRAATGPVALAAAAHRQAWRSLVSAYVFVSAAQRDLLAALRLDPGRVFVRHNLIPAGPGPRRPDAGLPAPVPSAPVPSAPVPSTASPGQPPAVVYAGRLDEAKGVRLLIAAWDAYLGIASERPSGQHPRGDSVGRPPGQQLRLVIAGTGPLERELASWASGRSSVELVGQLDPVACASLIASAHAVLVPSAWEEPFGLVVVEAMAAGVPPVAAGHGSLPELIADGVDGVIFAPGDPADLGRVLADVQCRPEHYAALGRQARESYEKRFDPDRNLDQLIEIYQFAISNQVRAR
jgi:glycosyltransferase involved in cell wall biosynthesis